ncbi:general secretion pathway protein GspK [Cerasicoccus fimbriatus]|uniref:general secretion pathway protein GspK n=1 Tax=Cerasicoccus fimbriatus TaxID=3014554 RepID=UPI0022B37EFD|nr:type II secretion system protein GspK [Cerasicoccus sp. TK19100]
MKLSVHSQATRRQGFLLLVVLVFLFMAAALVVSLSESMLRNIRSTATASARDDLRITAFSAMEIALATLAEIKELDGKLHSPSQGWGNPMSYAPVQWPANTTVTVTITDETGKIPLNPPNRERIQQLLDSLGVDFSQGEELIDAYMDWIDEDDLERLNGAEEDYYRNMTPPRKPPNQPITSHDAFRYIKGFDELFFTESGAPNALFKRFKDSTSFYHEHEVNINTASDAILGMLEENAGLDRHALDDLKLGLDQKAGTEDDGWPASADDITINSDAPVGYEAHVFRITVQVEQGDKQFQLAALIDDEGGSDSSNGGNNGGNGGGNNGDVAGEGNGQSGNGLLIPGEVNVEPNPQSDDEESKTGDSGGSSSQSVEHSVVYTNGQWRFLELNENRPEDG